MCPQKNTWNQAAAPPPANSGASRAETNRLPPCDSPFQGDPGRVLPEHRHHHGENQGQDQDRVPPRMALHVRRAGGATSRRTMDTSAETTTMRRRGRRRKISGG